MSNSKKKTTKAKKAPAKKKAETKAKTKPIAELRTKHDKLSGNPYGRELCNGHLILEEARKLAKKGNPTIVQIIAAARKNKDIKSGNIERRTKQVIGQCTTWGYLVKKDNHYQMPKSA